MELLEKITLYDLLGYTVPGAVLLFVISGLNFQADLSLFAIIAFGVASYLVGNLLSEVTYYIVALIWKNKKIRSAMYLESELEELEMSERVVSNALKKAGKLRESETGFNIKVDLWKYYMNMYSDIQADKDYVRIHNYASAALLYRNMALSILLCLFIFIFQNRLSWQLAFFLLIAVIFFAIGWFRFDKRVVRYTIYWYVVKYTNK